MESSLHRQLKFRYSSDPARHEVWVGDVRVDVLRDNALVEIQHSSLSALRAKVRGLLCDFEVIVVKPLAARTRIVRRPKRNAEPDSVRMSPRHESWLHLFDELVHFIDVFPHPSLRLDVLLVDIEEDRTPKPRRRFRGPDFRVLDRRLIEVTAERTLRTAADLATLLPAGLPQDLTTAELARGANIPRWLAQKALYCLRKTGAAIEVGKRRNERVYHLVRTNAAKPTRRSRAAA